MKPAMYRVVNAVTEMLARLSGGPYLLPYERNT